MTTEVEFKKGDIVTYHPYEKAISMRVRAVGIDKRNGEVIYRLSDLRYRWETTVTSGRSIKESKYYEPWIQS